MSISYKKFTPGLIVNDQVKSLSEFEQKMKIYF